MQNKNINEALDLKTIQTALSNLKKFIPNLDVTTLLKNTTNIINAVKELSSLDNKQNINSLLEGKKPILVPFFSKYGLLIGGIAMAIMCLVGTPPEPPSDAIIKMITYGLQGKTAEQFFTSLTGYQSAEMVTDIFGGMTEAKKYSSYKQQQLLTESWRSFAMVGQQPINDMYEPTEYDDAVLEDGTLVCAGCLEELLESERTIIQEAKYQGRTVTLNKPFLTPSGPKKRSVYVKNPKTGNVKKVNFGDPNMRIKKSDPKRRKSFRARHKCSQKKDKTSAGYWSCKFWE